MFKLMSKKPICCDRCRELEMENARLKREITNLLKSLYKVYMEERRLRTATVQTIVNNCPDFD